MSKIALADRKKPTRSKGGRPKGRKDQKPRKPKAKKTIKKPAPPADQKPPIPEVTPYPKAGDNPAFEGKLDKLEDFHSEGRPAPGPDNILFPHDIAEYVSWPFLFWAQSQKLDRLKLKDAEALEIAEPLCRILNRHDVGSLIPPDWLDGLQVIGRAVPAVVKRHDIVIEERERRAEQGGPAQPAPGPRKETPARSKVKQGAPFREPEKV